MTLSDEQLRRIERAMTDVLRERRRQFEKWGDQRHQPERWLAILAEEVGEVAEAILKPLEGETGEADDAGLYRAELVQVAAVAVAAIEHLDAEMGA